jgi:hypothetical protein
MKLESLFEDIDNTISPEIQIMLTDYFMMAMEKGMNTIPLDSVIVEVKNSTNIDIRPSDLITILSNIPTVSDVNSEEVTLSNQRDDDNPIADSKDKVADMAKQRAKKVN